MGLFRVSNIICKSEAAIEKEGCEEKENKLRIGSGVVSGSRIFRIYSMLNGFAATLEKSSTPARMCSTSGGMDVLKFSKNKSA